MPSVFANLAAAVTAGYKSTVLDRGVLAHDLAERWECTLEKLIVGPAQRRGGHLRAFGTGSSQANAEARALSALHAQRNLRYGAAAAGGSKSHDLENLTVDVS